MYALRELLRSLYQFKDMLQGHLRRSLTFNTEGEARSNPLKHSTDKSPANN